MTAKAQGIGKGRGNRFATLGQGKGACRILVQGTELPRHGIVGQGLSTNQGLQGPHSPQEVAGQGLGGADPGQVLTKNAPKDPTLYFIVQGR